MDFVFTATKMSESRERVERAHPLSLSALKNPDASPQSAAAELIRELLAFPHDHRLGQFLDGLSGLKRRLLPTLITHEAASVRRRCRLCLEQAPELIEPRYLWRAFCQHAARREGAELARLGTADEGRAKLEPLQLVLMRHRLRSHERVVAGFWKMALRRGATSEQLMEAADIPPHSALARDLRTRLLTHVPLRLWEAEPIEQLREGFVQATRPVQAQCLQHVHASTHEKGLATKPEEAARTFAAEVLMPLVRPRQELLDALAAAAPHVARWWRELLAITEMTGFFEKVSDNERFEFWRGYLSEMRDVRGDLDNLRLFIDFGGFGVLEFGETGNAAYIYRREDFERFRRRNFEKRMSNNALKNQDINLGRITHHSGWKRKATQKMRGLLRSQRGDI